MNPLRVAIVSPYNLAVPGGVQDQVIGLGVALAAKGLDVDVLAPLDRSAPRPGTGGARLIPLGKSVAVPSNGSRAPVAPFPSIMARTVRQLRGGHYDVVHLHEPFVPGPTLAALAAGPTPMIGTFHRAGIDLAYRSLGAATGRLCARLEVAVAVSGPARDTARAVLGRHLPEPLVLWNGVDEVRIAAAPPSPSEVPAVVFVGRHEQRKGLSVLLDAFAKVSADAVLWVLGSGPETDWLRSRTSDERVVWLGQVDEDEKRSRLRGAAVVSAPSLGGESFGLVVAEALAAGAAVVASDIPGYRAALGDAGILVPHGEAESLAEALGRLLADDELRSTLAAAGVARAHELSIDRLADRYAELYEVAATT